MSPVKYHPVGESVDIVQILFYFYYRQMATSISNLGLYIDYKLLVVELVFQYANQRLAY